MTRTAATEVQRLDSYAECVVCGRQTAYAVAGVPVHYRLGGDCRDLAGQSWTAQFYEWRGWQRTRSEDVAIAIAPWGSDPGRCVLCGQASLARCSNTSPSHDQLGFQPAWAHPDCVRRAGARGLDRMAAAVTGAAATQAHSGATKTKQQSPGKPASRERRPTTPPRQQPGSFTAPAAVLHGDGLWLADGRRVDLADGELHAGDLYELARELRLGVHLGSWTDNHGTRHERSEPGLIAVTADGRKRLGLELPAEPTSWDAAITEATHGHQFVTAAIDAGYHFRRPAPAGENTEGDDEPETDTTKQVVRAWSRVWADRGKSLRIAFLEAIDPRDVPVLADGPGQLTEADMQRDDVILAGPATVARRLALYARHTGYPFHTTVHTTGLAHIESTRRKGMSTHRRPCPDCGALVEFPRKKKDRDREDDATKECPECRTRVRPHYTYRELFAPHDPPEPLAGHTEIDLTWSRRGSDDELAKNRFVHVFDAGGAYLSAAGIELGIGEPTHYPDGAPFDPRTPGMHLVHLPYEQLEEGSDGRYRLTANDPRHPNPLDPAGKVRFLAADSDPDRQAIWVAAPALEIATELWGEFEILESHVWQAHGRIFYPWYEQMKDAREALDADDGDGQAARALLKNVYKLTFGMLESARWRAGKPGYAPHRRHHIVAKVRANLVRKIVKIGTESETWPVRVSTDAVAYLSDEPDPTAAWPGDPERDLGRGLGKFDHEASGLLVDQTRYLTGQGTNQLTPAKQWDPAAAGMADAPYPDLGRKE